MDATGSGGSRRRSRKEYRVTFKGMTTIWLCLNAILILGERSNPDRTYESANAGKGSCQSQIRSLEGFVTSIFSKKNDTVGVSFAIALVQTVYLDEQRGWRLVKGETMLDCSKDKLVEVVVLSALGEALPILW